MNTRRDDLIESINGHIRRIAAGGGEPNVLFITGEAGIGKTTLIRAVAVECARMPDPPAVATVECSTPLAGQDIGEVEALQPWAQLMAQLATGELDTRHDTRKLVAGVALAWLECVPVVGNVLSAVAQTTVAVKQHMSAPADSARSAGPQYAASQEQMFQQYINFLTKLAERTTLVLAIDDFHWADTSSSNLLFSAARQLLGKRVLFVIAYRADDASSSRGGEGHPILHVRNELERYSLAAEIGVPRMNADDLDTLLRKRYANYKNDDRFEEWIARVSGGNALFITQFLNTLEEDGYIDRASGTIGQGYEGIRVPHSAQAVVQERIRRLSEESRELLRYASVEGDTFTASMLARVLEMPQLKLLQKLRLVEQTHQLIRSLGKVRVYSTEASAYQFAHVLLHRALYDGLSEEERELLHQAVFDALKEEWDAARESRADLSGMAARMATHAEALGNDLFAAEALLDGATACWKDYAGDEALRLLEGALACLDRVPTSAGSKADVLRGRVLLKQSAVHSGRNDHDRAAAALAIAVELFERSGSRQDLLDAFDGQMGVMHNLGRYDDASALAQKLLSGSREIGYLKGEAHALNGLGVVSMARGDFGAAQDAFRDAIAIYERIDDTGGMASSFNNIGLISTSIGDYARALECFQRTEAVSEAAGNRITLAGAFCNIGMINRMLGRFDVAAEHLGRSLELFEAIGDRQGLTYALTHYGLVETELGNRQAALAHYERARSVAFDTGDPRLLALAQMALGDHHEESGSFDLALEHYHECLRIVREINRLDLLCDSLAGLGSVHRKKGDLESSLEFLSESLEIARRIGHRENEARLLGELGLLEYAIGESLDAEERNAAVARAAESIEECIDLLRQLGRSGVEVWERELERVRSSLESAPAS